MEQRVVVAGWGQVTQPKILDKIAQDPMGLMALASSKAGQMMRSKRVLKDVDGIMIVQTVSRHYPSPAMQLAEKLGATPRFTKISGIGGNSPQTLVNRAAGMIARNELDSILIAGAEAYVQRDPAEQRVENALFRGIPEDYAGDDLIGSTRLENRHGIEHPMQGFPLFETALWAASGMDLQAYLLQVGTMWSQFSKTAAKNPLAWSRNWRTPEEIITPGVDNRQIAFPYTKYMNAFVTVDQGAAIILMSEEKAAGYSHQNRRTVYFLGGGYARDRQRFMVEKSDFTASPPLKAAVEKALTRSRMPLADLECFDLYSCFPCAVSIAKKMIGISDDDPRPLTLTGGLGFFGGPGNNYNLHAIATLAEKISTGKRSNGLVTALGWFMHKHAAGVYGSSPREGRFEVHDITDQQENLAGDEPVRIKEQVTGTGTIETYTLVFGMDQQPAYAVMYGRTGDGFRFVAQTRSHPDIFNHLTKKNRVGDHVTIQFDRSKNMNIADLI